MTVRVSTQILPDLQPPRPIRPEDLAAVLALIDGCYREYGLALNLADDCEKHLADPGAYFRAHGGEFWVVPGPDGPAATVALAVENDRNPPLGELKSMYVSPRFRRRGVGRRLVQMVMDAARAAGCRELVLWSDTRFGAAHAMYESLGFTRVGRRELTDSNNSAEFGYARAL